MTRTEVEIIRDGKIVAADMGVDSVLTAAIGNLQVTTEKIADRSVTAQKLDASINFFPTGGIVIWSGSASNIPSGWTLCDGTNGTPDLRNRFVVGAGNGSNYAVGNVGGADSVSLTVAQLPSHSHGLSSAGNHSHSGSTANAGNHGHSGSTASAGNHTHTGSTTTAGYHSHSLNFDPIKNGGGICAGRTPSGCHDMSTGGGINGAGDHAHSLNIQAGGEHSHSLSLNAAGDHSHSLSISAGGDHSHSVNSTGSGSAHENRPPYYALCYIMKT